MSSESTNNSWDGQIRFCTSCGAKLTAGNRFCTSCGAKLSGNDNKEINNIKTDTRSQQPARPVETKNVHSQKPVNTMTISGKKIGAIVAGVIVVAAIGVGAFFAVPKLKDNTEKKNDKVVESNDTSEESDNTEMVVEKDTDINSDDTTVGERTPKGPDYVPLTADDADYNLSPNNNITISGIINGVGSNNSTLKLENKIMVTDGNNALCDIDMVELNLEGIGYDIKNSVTDGEKVTIDGEGFIENGKFIIKGKTVRGSDGIDLASATGASKDYIIPDSDTRKLTSSDISELSLQELNYAKNEIYARHGRKFDSAELRAYFESKSWYKGTIDPSDFSDNMLSGIERDNVTLLKNKEFSISPNGYQLDQ
ncbi:MAG: YARHG domain-containing protein [Lachnospiraceae bacterium]|nr:YARHG domain-containing protein [Lachnospiraceae bacterium]